MILNRFIIIKCSSSGGGFCDFSLTLRMIVFSSQQVWNYKFLYFDIEMISGIFLLKTWECKDYL